MYRLIPMQQFCVHARWPYNSVILDPTVCDATVFASWHFVLYSRRGSYKLLCLPSLLGVLIVKFDTAGFLKIFPFYQVNFHSRLFTGRSQIIVAGGDVPPFRFRFDRMVFHATFIVRKTLWLVQGSVR